MCGGHIIALPRLGSRHLRFRRKTTSGLGGLDAAQQHVGRGHCALAFVGEDILAVYENGHVAALPGFDLRLDTEFLFCRFLQAHGCTAEVKSKEAALDFNVHDAALA